MTVEEGSECRVRPRNGGNSIRIFEVQWHDIIRTMVSIISYKVDYNIIVVKWNITQV